MRDVARSPCDEARTERRREPSMDFIERIFGISPNGGSETFDFLLFAIPIVAYYMIYKVRSKMQREKALKQRGELDTRS
jgi:hypothetical protein